MNRLRRVDPCLLATLVLAALLFGFHLQWGLPNGNSSWAADAIGPVTTLSVVHNSFSTFNSGWYYFKYSLAYPLLLLLAAAPYLAWLLMSGGWRAPSSSYPHGFADPETALFTMAMLGRGLNVLFALAVVAVTYGIGNRLFGRGTARLGAFLVATAYPVVYYAHTTNIDISYLFWLLLALYAAVAAARTAATPPWAWLGIAAAMAVSTKEQGFAFLLPLPILALAARVRVQGASAVWSRPTLAMAAGAIATTIVANNLWFNPMGFVARIAYILGRPLEEDAPRLLPVEFALWKGAKEVVYLRQLWDGVESTLGLPVVCLAIAGVVLLLLRHRTAAAWLLLPLGSQYYLSLRGLDLITLRYLLPVSAVLAVAAAAALCDAWGRARAPRARAAVIAVVVAICSLSLARAIELDWLLYSDSRYQAEEWIAAHAAAGDVVEYYQKETYVPRFRGAAYGRFVAMGERTIDAFAERRPWGAVVSSASIRSITHGWRADWRESRDLLQADPEAVEFREALEGGSLDYRRAATFFQNPTLLRLRITSLAPEIRIYVRD